MLYRKVERTIEQYLKSGSNRILYNIFKKRVWVFRIPHPCCLIYDQICSALHHHQDNHSL